MGVSIFVKAHKNPMHGYLPSANIRLLVFNLVNDMIYALFDNVSGIPRTLLLLITCDLEVGWW